MMMDLQLKKQFLNTNNNKKTGWLDPSFKFTNNYTFGISTFTEYVPISLFINKLKAN